MLAIQIFPHWSKYDEKGSAVYGGKVGVSVATIGIQTPYRSRRWLENLKYGDGVGTGAVDVAEFAALETVHPEIVISKSTMKNLFFTCRPRPSGELYSHYPLSCTFASHSSVSLGWLNEINFRWQCSGKASNSGYSRFRRQYVLNNQ